MTAFPSAFSSASDWAHVAKELADGLAAVPNPGAGIGILYATDMLADDLRSIVTYLRQTTGVDTWIGTLGFGVIHDATGAFDRPAAAAMVLALGSSDIRLLPLSPIPDLLTEEIAQWAETVRPAAGIVHGDAAAPSVAELVEKLSRRSGAFLVGGLTGSRTAQHQIAGEVGAGGVSGILLSPDVPVTVGLSQGCTPLGPVRRVTSANANVIAELDDRPALEVFKEDIGEMLAHDLNRVAGYIHVAFPVAGSDTNDYMVRSLIAIDPEHGWLGVGSDVSAGDRIMFVRRDPASAKTDLERMLADTKRRLPGPARGALYVSCVARGPHMFGDENAEAEIVKAALGDIPVIGFYAAGEISNDRLYGFTGVLMVFG